jgi:hypothetical protein
VGRQRIGVVPFRHFCGDGKALIQRELSVLLAEQGLVTALSMARGGVAGFTGQRQRGTRRNLCQFGENILT